MNVSEEATKAMLTASVTKLSMRYMRVIQISQETMDRVDSIENFKSKMNSTNRVQ